MTSRIIPIAGDASFRKFFRIIRKKNKKIIVFSDKEKYKNLVVYTAINQFLRNNKILAPKLYSIDYSKGSMVIEDFVDLSLYKVLIKSKNKLKIYKKIINLLIKIQNIKPKSKVRKINGGS